MTKSELAHRLAAAHHLSQRDGGIIVATIFREIAGALARGDRIELRGFGSFTVGRRNPQIGRNPRSGESVNVPERRIVHFKSGKPMRDRLNRG
jgi:integration host factor subunit beta